MNVIPQVIKFRGEAGRAGQLSRRGVGESIMPAAQQAANPVPFYGWPAAVDQAGANKIRPFGAGDTAALFYGFLKLDNFVQESSTTNVGEIGFDGSVAPVKGTVSVVERGYMYVRANGAAAPYKGCPVYVRIAQGATDPALQPIGGIEAAADGGNTVALPAVFESPADAYGVSEINIRP